MTTPNAFEIGMSWRHLMIAGPKDRVDDLLARVEQSFPPGWERNTTAEQRAAAYRGSLRRSRCYARKLDGRDVWLWLDRPSDLRVQGGLVEPTKPVRYAEDVAEAILDFRARVLEPAAAAAGLVVGSSRLRPLSAVSGEVLDALWAYCESSRFTWPPAGDALLPWREFVIRAHQDHPAFNLDELKSWLTDKGFPADQVRPLFDRLVSEDRFLDQYDDLRQLA